MLQKKQAILCFFLLFLKNTLVQGQEIDYQSLLKTNSKAVINNLATDYHLLDFNTVDSLKDEVLAYAKIVKQIEEHLYIVTIPPQAVEFWKNSSPLKLQAVNDWWKPTLQTTKLLKSNFAENELLQFQVEVNDFKSAKAFFEDNQAFFHVISVYGKKYLTLLAKASDIRSKVLPQTWITFISHRRLPPRVEAEVRGIDYVPNQVNLIKSTLPQLEGTNMAISIKENAFDTTDIDLKGRVLSSAIASIFPATHATQMASLLVGAGNLSHESLGIAPKAKVSASDFRNLFPDNINYFKSDDISVQNHSYGIGIENFYGTEAAAYDEQVYTNPYLLHVFSAGNIGDLLSIEGPYAGVPNFATLTGAFKMAKNILTVGGIDAQFNIETRSSRGPAYDGRLKPELVAYGAGGTSDAAAMVSGTALLLQEAYKSKEGELPSSALIKALLFATAKDLETKGIDYLSGYGNLQAKEAVGTLLKKQYFEATLAENEENYFKIAIDENTKNARIALVWNDLPASPNEVKALKNDLDLSFVHVASGATFQPWVLNTFPNKDSLALPAQRGVDRLNPAELVSVDFPEAGEYEIKVKGHQLSSERQQFFVAFYIEKSDTLLLQYPTTSDELLAGESIEIQWKNTFNAPANLWVSVAGKNYELIQSNITGEQARADFILPDTSVTLQFKIQVGEQEFISDTFFSAKRRELKTGYDCTEDFMLFWEEDPQAQSYEILRLGAQNMEVLSTTQDTLIVLDKSTFNSSFYSVKTFYANGFSKRSKAFKYDSQGVGCYVRNFLAKLNNNSVSDLSLSLGTLYNIKKITFEKRSEDETAFNVFQELEQFASTDIEVQDNNVAPGITTYRAIVTLNNGNTVISNEAGVAYADDTFFRVYPNPVEVNTPFLVFSKVDALDFNLYNLHGQKVFSLMITEQIEAVESFDLIPGLYLYTFSKEGAIKQTGKILFE